MHLPVDCGVRNKMGEKPSLSNASPTLDFPVCCLSDDHATPGAGRVTVCRPGADQFVGTAVGDDFQVAVIDVGIEDDANRVAGWCESQDLAVLLEETERPKVSRIRAGVHSSG